MLEAGKKLQDRYLIEKQIGQGGMGAVYVAKDQRFGSVVAIKETLFVGESFEKAFEREARLLNSLRHPALPNVRDYFFENNKQYLVMEFITGEDLSEKLEKNGKAFNLEEVLDWTQQLLEALDFLHTQEMPVIHRDIKPQNLKLTPKGQIILLDFGLAKGNPTDASHLTNVNSVFGYSRNYASLEQMQGTGTDPRSDIYSLAATVYHLITGVPPVDALTRAMKVLSEHADPLVSADEAHEQVPKGIANILNNAMNLNSNQRPASAKELSEMLKNSEEYEDLENRQTTIAKAVPTNFLNQDTQIFPAENKTLIAKSDPVISAGKSEFETKIDTNKYSSQNFATNVFAADSLEKPKSNKRNSVMAIGAFLSLLLMILGVSAFYFVKMEKRDAAKNETDANAANNADAKPSLPAEFAAANSNPTLPESPAAPAAPETVANIWTPTAKTETKSDSTTIAKSDDKKSTTQKKDKTVMVFDDPEDGRVTISEDKIETDDVIITDNGVVFKKPPTPNAPANLNVRVMPGQIKTLSPEQIEKLKQVRLKALEAQREAEKMRNNQQIPAPPQTSPQ